MIASLHTAEQIDILLVEDSPADILMTREALAFHNVRHPLHVVTDGVVAMQYLRREGQYHGAPRPNLIILDLNLPRKSGREVLMEVKADADLRTIPVVILTTSAAEEDVEKSYGLNANCYITKPVDFTAYTDVIRTIDEFWLHIVTLPPNIS